MDKKVERFSEKDIEILEEIIIKCSMMLCNEIDKLEWSEDKKLVASNMVIDTIYNAKNCANNKIGFDVSRNEGEEIKNNPMFN